MEFVLEQVRPEEVDEVTAFLRKIFHAPSDARFLLPQQMQWKCFDPRPDWHGSRSYVYREDGVIVAHACVVPTDFVTPEGTIVRTLHVIDWAGDPSLPGIGLGILRGVCKLVDVRIGYGGSVIASAMNARGHARKHPYERIGGQLVLRRRSFRPWSSFHDPSVARWKAAARAARDIWRNARSPLGTAGKWTAHPVAQFDDRLPDFVRSGNRTGLTLPIRTPALLNYMLRCPTVSFRGFWLEKDGELRGHLLLADHGEDIRVADLVIDSGRPEDWAECSVCALLTAKQTFPRGGYLSIVAAPESIDSSLRQAGFRECERRNIMLEDKLSMFPTSPLPVMNMVGSDEAYL